MSKLSVDPLRAVLFALACIAIGSLAGPPISTAAADKFQDVVVRNSDGEPVPTKAIGTTAVQGAVSIVGIPTVNIAGSARIPVQFTFEVRFSGTSSVSTSNAYTVPAGKRLEIRHVDVQESTPAEVQQIHLQVMQGGERFAHYLTSSRQGSNDTVVSQRISAYADPGTAVVLVVFLDRILDGWLMYGTFTGTLTDL